MQVISINPNQKSIQTLSIEMKPDTIYSFFNSILIDEINSLNSHTIYTDANALEENKTPYFLGEQLLIGDTLITGISADGDIDTHIGTEILEELISYDVSAFYKDCLNLFSHTDVNLYRLFSLQKGQQRIDVNIEWVLATFNIADEQTKTYFLDKLKESLNSKNTQEVITKMAQQALNMMD